MQNDNYNQFTVPIVTLVSAIRQVRKSAQEAGVSFKDYSESVMNINYIFSKGNT